MKKLFLSTIATFALIGCGGGGGSTSTNTETTITAVDGYIKDATLKDSSGLTATYSSNGKYTFSKTPTYPITLTGGTLNDTNISFDINMSAQSGSKVISPITTFLGSDSNLLSKFSNLGLNQTVLDEFEVDYIESNDIDLAKLSQLLYVILKDENLTTTFKQNLENNNSIDSLDKLFDLASLDINSSNWINAQKNCANSLITKIKSFNANPSTIETFLQNDKTPFSQGCKNHAPSWTTNTIDSGVTVDEEFEPVDIFIIDLTPYLVDEDDDATISIVEYHTPNNDDDVGYYNFIIHNNKLYVQTHLDPDWIGIVTVTVEANDGLASSRTNIHFTFNNRR